MIRKIIVDSSVIAAYLSERDQWHKSTFPHFIRLPKPFITCEAVVTETCFLVKNALGGEQAVLDLITKEIVRIDFSLSAEVDNVRSLMNKYTDVPISLADACLVRMCELEKDSAIFTLDTDFQIYRKHRNSRIQLITHDGI